VIQLIRGGFVDDAIVAAIAGGKKNSCFELPFVIGHQLEPCGGKRGEPRMGRLPPGNAPFVCLGSCARARGAASLRARRPAARHASPGW